MKTLLIVLWIVFLSSCSSRITEIQTEVRGYYYNNPQWYWRPYYVWYPYPPYRYGYNPPTPPRTNQPRTAPPIV
jgi:hypothetical protein